MSGAEPIRAVTRLLQIFGLFPVLYTPNHPEDVGQPSRSITVSKTLLFLTAAQVGLLCFRVYGYYQILLKLPHGTTLYAVLFTAEVTHGLLAIVLSLDRLPRIRRCLLTAEEVLTDPLPRGIRLMVFVNFLSHFVHLAVQLVIIVYRVTVMQYLYLASQVLNDLMPMATNSCVMILLAVVHTSYSRVNRQIARVADHQDRTVTLTADQVAILAADHWTTGDLLQSVQHTFAPAVLVYVSYSLVKLVLVIYYTFIFEWNFVGNLLIVQWARVSFGVSYVVSTLIGLLAFCAMADNAKNEGRRSQALLFRLLRREGENMDRLTQKQVRVFQLQVRSRTLQLSGCDLFVLDKTLFYGLVMQVISYFIILVQFKPFQ